MGVKTLLAADVTATIHGAQTAADARAAFRARFSQRRYSDAGDVPTVSLAVHGDASPAAAFATLTGAVSGLKQVRRVAADGGLRLVVEPVGAQVTTLLSPADADRTLRALLDEHGGDITTGARVFLRCGRQLLELVP
jgi:tyrosyl-tRNA synthetase